MSGEAPRPSRWTRFWLDPRDGAALGMVRIGVALVGLGWAATLAPALVRRHTDAGELPIGAARFWGGEWVARWGMWDALGSWEPTVGLYVVLGVALAFLLVGFHARLAAVVSWLLLTWFQYRNPTYLDAGADLLRLAVMHLAMAHLALDAVRRPWSLDRRLADAAGPCPVPAWTLRLFQIQLALVYFGGGVEHAGRPSWLDGRALVYALRGAAPDAPLPGFATVMPVAAAVTLAVVAWQLLFPLLVAHRRVRPWALSFGVALHGATLTLGSPLLPLAHLAHYPAFLDGADVRRLARWPAALVSRRVHAAPPAGLPGDSDRKRVSASGKPFRSGGSRRAPGRRGDVRPG